MGRSSWRGLSGTAATTTSRWCATTPTGAGHELQRHRQGDHRLSAAAPRPRLQRGGAERWEDRRRGVFHQWRVNYDFALVRYNANGSLDTSFNGTGKVTTPIGSSDDYRPQRGGAERWEDRRGGVFLQRQQLRLRAGALQRQREPGHELRRHGKVTTAIGSSDDYGYSVAVQSDGKIVVAGYSYNGSNYDFALVRYKANGSLDTSFNGTGKVPTVVGSNERRRLQRGGAKRWEDRRRGVFHTIPDYPRLRAGALQRQREPGHELQRHRQGHHPHRQLMAAVPKAWRCRAMERSWLRDGLQTPPSMTPSST